MKCSLCSKDFIPVNGVVHRNEVYTIVEEADGPGASKWGGEDLRVVRDGYLLIS